MKRRQHFLVVALVLLCTEIAAAQGGGSVNRKALGISAVPLPVLGGAAPVEIRAYFSVSGSNITEATIADTELEIRINGATLDLITESITVHERAIRAGHR